MNLIEINEYEDNYEILNKEAITLNTIIERVVI
jgi:hypothetical protein